MVVIPSSESGNLARKSSLKGSKPLAGESSSAERAVSFAQSVPVSPVGPSHIEFVQPESLLLDAQQFISIMDDNEDLFLDDVQKPQPDVNDEAKVTSLEWIAYSRCESMSKHRDISKGIRAMKLAIKLSGSPKKKAELSRHLLEWVMKISSD